MRLTKPLILSICAVISFTLSYSAYRNYNLDHFSCSSTNVISNGMLNSSARVNIIFDGGKGSATIEGVSTDSAGNQHPFRRYTRFTFLRTLNQYEITTTSALVLTGDTTKSDEIDRLFPPNITQIGVSILAISHPVGNSGYAFTNGAILLTYCQR